MTERSMFEGDFDCYPVRWVSEEVIELPDIGEPWFRENKSGGIVFSCHPDESCRDVVLCFTPEDYTLWSQQLFKDVLFPRPISEQSDIWFMTETVYTTKNSRTIFLSDSYQNLFKADEKTNLGVIPLINQKVDYKLMASFMFVDLDELTSMSAADRNDWGRRHGICEISGMND